MGRDEKIVSPLQSFFQTEAFVVVQNRNVAICRMSLADYRRACQRNQRPPIAAIVGSSGNEIVEALACVADSIGALEPLSAHRPPACSPRSVFDRWIDVPPATTVDGVVVPSEAMLLQFCAPIYSTIMIDILRVHPENLTAVQSGEVISPKMEIFGFSKGFCSPAEAGTGNNIGVFYNTEHLILCPSSGFDLKARNHSPCSNALFSVHAESWEAC